MATLRSDVWPDFKRQPVKNRAGSGRVSVPLRGHSRHVSNYGSAWPFPSAAGTGANNESGGTVGGEPWSAGGLPPHQPAPRGAALGPLAIKLPTAAGGVFFKVQKSPTERNTRPSLK